MRGRMPEFEMPSGAEQERARVEATEAALVRERDVADLAADDARRDAAAVDAGGDARGGERAVPGAPHEAPSAVARRGARSSRRERAASRLRAVASGRRAAFVAGVLVAGLAVLGWSLVASTIERGSVEAAQGVLDAYAAAVADGDLAAAAEMEGLDPAVADLGLLEGGAVPRLAPAVTCPELRIDGDAAVATCGVGGGGYGVQTTGSVRLVRDGGWRVERGLAVAAPVSGSRLGAVQAVGGAALPPDAATLPVWLYPGTYDAEVRMPAGLEALGGGRIVVLEGSAYLDLQPVASAPLVVEIQTAALDLVLECAAAPTEGCPDLSAFDDLDAIAATSDVAPTVTSERAVAFLAEVRATDGSASVQLDVAVAYGPDRTTYRLTVAPVAP